MNDPYYYDQYGYDYGDPYGPEQNSLNSLDSLDNHHFDDISKPNEYLSKGNKNFEIDSPDLKELISKPQKQQDGNAYLQEFTLQEHFKKHIDTKNLPRKNINDESDILDFILADKSQLEDLLSSIENQILSVNESGSAYLRVGKLFNFICVKLEKLISSQSLLDEEVRIMELTSLLDLFQRCLEAIRLSSFSNICLMPEYSYQLAMDQILFEKLLDIGATVLDQLPQQTEKLLTYLIVFVINPPAPFVTSIDQAADCALGYFAQNLFNSLTQSFFKLLSVILVTSPADVVPGYIDLVILPLKEIMMDSILSKSSGNTPGEEKKVDGVESFDYLYLDEEDELNYEIMKFLLVAINNPLAAKQLIETGFHDALYGALRRTCASFTKNPIKIPPKVSELATSLLRSLLTELDSEKMATFRDMIYRDICQSIEEQKVEFVRNIITPIMAGTKHQVTPLCIHLEGDIENSLDHYRSTKSGSQQIDQDKSESKGFKSEAMSHQERGHLLQQIQHLSLDQRSKSLGVPLKVNQLEWKRLFKVDYSSHYPANANQTVFPALQYNIGALVIFHCFIDDEVCKVGVFCDRMVHYYPTNPYGYMKQKPSTTLVAYKKPDNFLFSYSQTRKLHFLSSEPPRKQPSVPVIQPSSPAISKPSSISLSKPSNVAGAKPSNVAGAKPSSLPAKSLPSSIKTTSAAIKNPISSVKSPPVSTVKKPEISKGPIKSNPSKPIPNSDSKGKPIPSKPIPSKPSNYVHKLVKPTGKPQPVKKDPMADVVLEFSNQKIILRHHGSILIEYSLSNPDAGKVVGSFKTMLSEEEKKGQQLPEANTTPSGISFIQGVECWILCQKQYKQALSEEELSHDQRFKSTKLLSECLRYLRRDRIFFVPQHLTLRQILSLFSKPQDKDITKQILCKIMPQEEIETIHQAQNILDLFKGSEQNILDLFLSSKHGVKWLYDRFNGRSDKFYEKILSLAKSDSKIARELLSAERLEEIFQRINRAASKKGLYTQFSEDIAALHKQLQPLLKIGSYQEILTQNEMFFYTLLKIVGAMLQNDITNYTYSCIRLKLEWLVYKALADTLCAQHSQDQFTKMSAIELIALLLNKISSMSGSVGAYSMIEPKSKEVPPFYYANPALEADPKKKIFQNLLSCLRVMFEQPISVQNRREAITKMKELKIHVLMAQFVVELDEGHTKFHEDLKTILRKWSEDIQLNEIFWEPLPEYDTRNPDAKNTLYQKLLDLKEQVEQTMKLDQKEESKGDSRDFSNRENQEDRLVNQMGTIAFVNEIEKNLKRYYDIEITEQTTDLSKYLTLPLNQAYPNILKELCVDSSSMKGPSGYDHHYSTSITADMNQQKTHRILKEIGDLSTSLPVSETNSIFVRYDKQCMDVMKALIFGSRDTPYAHGAFLYDIYIPHSYPNGPPLVNLETTGYGEVRFNPNLYNCGKVCLSLLGTWRGNANENWNPKLSTLLQVLVSIQSIIMTEGVYYNEPGYEKVTKESAILNQGYCNIVKYANIRYAMIDALKKPAPWFKDVIQIHFYLKKDMILEDCGKWIAEAKKNQARYADLVNSHNPTLAQMFSQASAYHDKLVEAVKELKAMFSKLNVSIEKSVRLRTIHANKKAIMELEDVEEVDIDTRVEKIENIDVSYDNKVHQRAIDINDEKVTNRWSRYIGAMGIDAVKKQANAQICLFGLNAVGVEIAKNIILSGVKRFTICDGKSVSMEDIAGQFYLTEEDIGKNRAKACLHKLQALNQYVIIDFLEISLDTCYSDLSNYFDSYNVMIACEGNNTAQSALNDYARKVGAYFVSAAVYGHFSRVFCDFGDNFQVLDKTGEEYQDMILKSISNDNLGLVTLIDGSKHNLQDGDEVMISQVVENPGDSAKKSINGTQHKVKVVDKGSFYIGDTTVFKRYMHNGIVKQLKQTETLNFKPLSQLANKFKTLPPFDQTISSSDWNFIPRVVPLHVAFQRLDWFVGRYGRLPYAWSDNDANIFTEEVMNELFIQFPDQWNEIQASEDSRNLMSKIVQTFSYTCSGVFPPLAAFIGGVAAQEVIKAITKKYMPINQYFYYETSEVISSLDAAQIKHEIQSMKQDRDLAFRMCVGDTLLAKLAASRLFMVGAGAIGCELLKNFAMIGFGTSKEKGKEGRIYLTDPDVIENSNLNRQFLFREKHIRKPKSTTAAAVAVSMNSKLKGNIKPLVEKVTEQNEYLFSNNFFESLDVVANALDNVNARKYVDSRCVRAQKPLLESGTLGPKGHVQVIIPFKTESYGSQQDPQEDNGDIPYCTLKMFPEETLHCVEWARDKFNKMFTQKPRSFEKVLEDAKSFDDLMAQDHKILAEACRFVKNWPQNFGNCVAWARNKFEKFFVNDIKQLLHTYPLDHKLENGSLFWNLPKRPPVTVTFDPNNDVHASFVAACACLRAITCGIPIDRKDPRNPKTKLDIAQQAAKFKPKTFVQSDKKAQSLKEQADKSNDGNKNENKKSLDSELSKEDIAKNILSCVKQRVGDLANAKNKMKCTPQEFEKDEDENFHIDVLYAMTNCRAINYKLAPMDWITVKLKAGRIIPALATTTSAIAALQTIELVKLIANVGVEDHKNSFLNLSIPILAQSEPSAAPVYKLTPKLTVNLWDRWEIDLALYEDITSLETLFNYLKSFTSLDPLDCLRGNTPVYIATLMNMPNKKKEQIALLQQPLKDTLGIRDQKYVDLTITFTSEEAKLNNPKDFTIKGVPMIRIIFSNSKK